MATMKEIKDVVMTLLHIQKEGIDIVVQDNGFKNYSSFNLIVKNGNAKYSDCAIMYWGEKGEENEETVESYGHTMHVLVPWDIFLNSH